MLFLLAFEIGKEDSATSFYKVAKPHPHPPSSSNGI